MRSPRRPPSFSVWSALLVLVAACVYAPTEVLVTLDTDSPPHRPMTVTVTIRRGTRTSGPGEQRTLVRRVGAEWVDTVRDAGSGDSGVRLIDFPASFAIVPRDGEPRDDSVTAVFDATVSATGPGEVPVSFRRIARFRFTPRTPTTLPIFLSLACGSATSGCTSVSADQCTVSVRCEEQDMTCGDNGTCVPSAVTPVILPRDAGADGLDAPRDRADTGDTGDADVRDADASMDAPMDVRADVGCPATCPGATNATGACVAGVCTMLCNAGFGDCDSLASNGCEVTLASSGANCGMCGHACPTGQMCSRGMCTLTCATGERACSGACVTIATDPLHCGSCANACPVPANATATCTASVCGFVCNAGFADCDGMAANGCEVDTRTNPDHCGGCGMACSGANVATRTCTAGACTGTCSLGFGDCDSDLRANGCEANLTTDVGHCGACATACSTNHITTPTCAAGMCTGACAAGFADCNGNRQTDGCEVNINTSAGNCGACGQACSSNHIATRTCTAGVCSGTCAAGYADCNSDKLTDGCEIATAADVNNCGGCGVVCSANHVTAATCAAGACTSMCAAGYADCNANLQTDGCEINTQTNANNCGACGRVCSANHMANRTCGAGVCNGTCAAGYTDCNANKQTDGCEVNTAGDANNCGACGRVCSSANVATRTCGAGVCTSTCSTGFANCDGNLQTNGCETSTNNNATNCGGCGVVCATSCTGNVSSTACVGSSCEVSACTASHYDIDSTCSNGCECADDATSGACASATSLGSIAIGGSVSRPGKIPVAGASDWFTITFPANYDTMMHGTGTPRVTFTVNDSSAFRFDVFGMCGGTALACGSGGGAASLLDWSYADNTAGSAFSTRSSTWPTTIYVRVFRTTTGSSCANYTLSVTR